MQSKLNAQGAVLGFVAWLTSREEQAVFSSSDNATPALDLACHFLRAQGLGNLDEGTDQTLVPMIDHKIQLRRPLETMTNEEALQCLQIHYANNPKITGFQVESVFGGAVRYTFKAAGSAQWNKGARRIEDFGFKVFNHLLSLGFNLK